MPLIPYPDIPSVPGVPGIPRLIGVNFGTTFGAVASVLLPNLVATTTDFYVTEWAILDQAGNFVIQPDSVVAFDYRAERRISNYPVEQGAFSSYNKVAVPYDLRLKLSCNGNGQMTREEFLAVLQEMADSTDLYSIATPDGTYMNANMDHFDLHRESRSGVTLLIVDAWFEEVQQTAVAAYSATKQPNGSDPVSQGQVTPTPPTTSQQSSYNSQPIQ